MRCVIWYHLCNLKNAKNIHGGVLILVKLQAKVCNFIKINTPPWVFFTFFKLYKCYQIAQRITYWLLCDCQFGNKLIFSFSLRWFHRLYEIGMKHVGTEYYVAGLWLHHTKYLSADFFECLRNILNRVKQVNSIFNHMCRAII